jgi:hypothetical protein
VDWDGACPPFLVCLQLLSAPRSSVEALLISSLFVTVGDMTRVAMWETTGFSSLYPQRLERSGLGPDRCVSESVHRLLSRVLALRSCSVDLLAKDWIALHLFFDLPDRVNYGRVIATSEKLPNPHE